MLQEAITSNSRKALLSNYQMGMHALHVLICYPAVSADLKLPVMENIHGTRPPMGLFLEAVSYSCGKSSEDT